MKSLCIQYQAPQEINPRNTEKQEQGKDKGGGKIPKPSLWIFCPTNGPQRKARSPSHRSEGSKFLCFKCAAESAPFLVTHAARVNSCPLQGSLALILPCQCKSLVNRKGGRGSSPICYHPNMRGTLLYHNTSHYDATVSAHLHWSNAFKQFIIYGDNFKSSVKYVVLLEKSNHSILSMNYMEFFYIVSFWCIRGNALYISLCRP